MDNYLGEIRVFPYNKTPNGWMPCEGQVLNISPSYHALFALIGNRYGGDGITTFALPDLRGRAMLGFGTAESGISYTIGTKGNVEKQTIASVPIHNHTISIANALGSINAQGATGGNLSQGATLASVTGEQINTFNTPGSTLTNVVTLAGIAPTGSNVAHENRKPYLTLQLCIASSGVWPSRT